MTTDLTFPETGLVESFALYRRRRPSVTLVIDRSVVGPLLFRNTQDAQAETHEFNGDLHAQANGEKFVSKERLTGLDLLRSFDDHDLIDDGYAYNEPGGMEQALNLGTLTYGVAGTGDQEFGIKSHVIEGYTYTTEPYDLMDRETRNAVYESGTMQDEEGEQSQALFEHVTIDPGNSFVHFVTLEAGTPAMLAYVMHNVLNTGVYGARSTRSGRTLDNSIVGVILSDHSVNLSTGELLMNYHESRADRLDSVDTYLSDAAREDWEVYGDALDSFSDFPGWYRDLRAVASRERNGAKRQLGALFAETTEQARTELLE